MLLLDEIEVRNALGVSQTCHYAILVNELVCDASHQYDYEYYH